MPTYHENDLTTCTIPPRAPAIATMTKKRLSRDSPREIQKKCTVLCSATPVPGFGASDGQNAQSAYRATTLAATPKAIRSTIHRGFTKAAP